ncbi:hypothetical protein HZH68_007931 [Vespula germanica]|uniref:Uncharacterized protein n=1 Tax=Vespula germanica TaxID=30212 RepID=A0A834K2T6_VESGE|nr:hypothetical protein HZH68_007931 [Vespula germanica]
MSVQEKEKEKKKGEREEKVNNNNNNNNDYKEKPFGTISGREKSINFRFIRAGHAATLKIRKEPCRDRIENKRRMVVERREVKGEKAFVTHTERLTRENFGGKISTFKERIHLVLNRTTICPLYPVPFHELEKLPRGGHALETREYILRLLEEEPYKKMLTAHFGRLFYRIINSELVGSAAKIRQRAGGSCCKLSEITENKDGGSVVENWGCVVVTSSVVPYFS